MDECRQQRVQKAGSRQADSYGIHRQGPKEVCHDDAPAAPGDSQSFYKVREAVSE